MPWQQYLAHARRTGEPSTHVTVDPDRQLCRIAIDAKPPSEPHLSEALEPGTGRLAELSRFIGYAIDPRVDAYIDALPDWQRAICGGVRE